MYCVKHCRFWLLYWCVLFLSLRAGDVRSGPTTTITVTKFIHSAVEVLGYLLLLFVIVVIVRHTLFLTLLVCTRVKRGSCSACLLRCQRCYSNVVAAAAATAVVTTQVYNEQIMDLLNPSPKPLRINEDPAKGVVVVAGLAEMVGVVGFRLEWQD